MCRRGPVPSTRSTASNPAQALSWRPAQPSNIVLVTAWWSLGTKELQSGEASVSGWLSVIVFDVHSFLLRLHYKLACCAAFVAHRRITSELQQRPLCAQCRPRLVSCPSGRLYSPPPPLLRLGNANYGAPSMAWPTRTTAFSRPSLRCRDLSAAQTRRGDSTRVWRESDRRERIVQRIYGRMLTVAQQITKDMKLMSQLTPRMRL